MRTMIPGRGKPWFGRVCLAGVLAICAVVASAAVGEGASPVFGFDPPEGTRYTVTATSTQQVDFSWGYKLAGQTTQENEVVIERDGTGYRATLTMTQIPALSGSPANDYVTLTRLKLEAEKGVPVIYRLDGDLNLLQVSGADRIGLRFRRAVRRDETLSEAARRVSRSMLTEEANLIGARDLWGRIFGSYLGRRTQLGSVWVTTGRVPFISGEVGDFYTAMKVMGGQMVGGISCVRVEFQSAQDPADLRAFLGPYAHELLEGKTAFAGSAKVAEAGYRLVDPATLLPYGQEVTRSLEFHLPGPGVGDVPVLIRENTTYRFDYPE